MEIKKKIFFVILALALIVPGLVWAQIWTPADPLVPCGGDYYDSNNELHPRPVCDQCELLHLLKNVIDFIMFYASPMLAVLFMIIGGVYMMLGGARPDFLAKGKGIFKDTLIGVLIVMLAWLFTNTLIRSLADPARIQDNGNWFSFSCSVLTSGATSGATCNGGIFNGEPCTGNSDCPNNLSGTCGGNGQPLCSYSLCM